MGFLNAAYDSNSFLSINRIQHTTEQLLRIAFFDASF